MDERELRLEKMKEQFLDAFLDALNKYIKSPTVKNKQNTRIMFDRYKVFHPSATIDHLFVRKEKKV